VSEVTWVDGLGAVHTDQRDSDAGKALVGGLGVAGLVTELLLQLQPPSHTAVDTRFKKHDGKLYEDLLGMLQVGQGKWCTAGQGTARRSSWKSHWHGLNGCC